MAAKQQPGISLGHQHLRFCLAHNLHRTPPLSCTIFAHITLSCTFLHTSPHYSHNHLHIFAHTTLFTYFCTHHTFLPNFLHTAQHSLHTSHSFAHYAHYFLIFVHIKPFSTFFAHTTTPFAHTTLFCTFLHTSNSCTFLAFTKFAQHT